GCFGLFKIRLDRGFRNILLGLSVLFFVFAFRYTVPDRYAFFIPFYCMVSIFIGLGTHLFQEQRNRKVLVFPILFLTLLPVGVYAAAPTLARRMKLDIGTRGDIPHRDDYEYFLRPWKTGYKGAENFADEALSMARENAVIYADTTAVAPLLLAQQVNGKRPDVKIVSGTVNSRDAPEFNERTIERLVKERPIYVVSLKPGYCPAFVLDNYDLVRVSILRRVVESEE
ncbi:MAG: hypothetical protein ACYSWW_17075, partial [Planctomycetota bacterium]